MPVVHEQHRAANHLLPAGRAFELVDVRVGRSGIDVLDAIGGLGGENSAMEKVHGIVPEGVQIPSVSGSEADIRYGAILADYNKIKVSPLSATSKEIPGDPCMSIPNSPEGSILQEA